MDLIVAATDRELRPFLSYQDKSSSITPLTVGAGCVEASLFLSSYLASQPKGWCSRVFLVGVGGAYQEHLTNETLCLAEKEILADYGLLVDHETKPLTFEGAPPVSLSLQDQLCTQLKEYFLSQNLPISSGPFLTVNGVTGRFERRSFLLHRHKALCENMEGFAVARVCQKFRLPFAEIRAISNQVCERHPEKWPIDAACQKLADSLRSFFLM